MKFDFQNAPIRRAVQFAHTLHLSFLALLRMVCLIAGIGALVAFLVARNIGATLSIPDYFSPILNVWQGTTKQFSPAEPVNIALNVPLEGVFGFSSAVWYDIAFFALALGFSLLFLERYFYSYLCHPAIKNGDNIAEFFDFYAAGVIERAMDFAMHTRAVEVSPAALLYTLSESLWGKTALVRLGFDPRSMQTFLREQGGGASRGIFAAVKGAPPFSSQSQKLFEDAYTMRTEHGHERITVFDLLVALFDGYAPFGKMLIDVALEKKDVARMAQWYENTIARQDKRKKFWLLENMLRTQPIGLEWAYGYPRILSQFTQDLTMQFQKGAADVFLVGREDILSEMEQAFSRSQEANILLVGEEGVGRTALVLGLAERLARGHSLPHLNDKRIFALDLPALLSSSSDPAEVQNTLRTVLNEALNVGNAVLFVEGLYNFIGAGKEGVGRADVSEVLVPYLKSRDMHIITTSDPGNFHKYLETRGEILSVFEKIEVPALSADDTLLLVEDRALASEHALGLFFLYPALKAIVEDADRYIQIAPFPQKAFDIFEDVVSVARMQKKKLVDAEIVHEVVRQKTGIPAGELGAEERIKLINLEHIMQESIVGQQQAIQAVSQTLRRLRSGLARRGKPAGVFLFVGPTGVGKTETAKTLTRVYFGGEDKMIRLDMSEYQNAEAVDRLLGSVRLNEPGQLPSMARDNPFAVLLLDEFEKAHKDILNVFLQVFDEGHVTDAWGRKVSFEQHMIIATSNAAAAQIREMVQQGIDPALQKEKIIDLLIAGGHFSPELLNRFDDVVVFHPLSQDQIQKVAQLMLIKLQKRLQEQGYFFKPSDQLVEFLSKVGFDPQFGARPMARAIQDRVEAVIATRILEGTIHKGEEFSVDSPNDDQIDTGLS